MNLFRLVIFSFFLITSLIANAESMVETSSGIIDGYKKGRVIYWDDIPYAKPPIDQLRWKAPRIINNSKNIISPKDNNIGINWPKKITYISEKDNYAKKLESHSNLPVFKS